MKLFNFNRNKTTETKGKRFNFSVPFLTIPKGYNISKPFLSLFRSGDGYEYFGTDNLYPNLLEQYYYLEPTHKASIDLKVGTSFSRYELNGLNEINKEAFELKNNLYATLEKLLYNVVIHEAFYIRVQKGNLPKLTVIDGGMIRFNQNKDKAYISSDWSRRNDIYSLPINDFNADDFIFMYQKQSIGSGTYNLPGYNSILNSLEQSQEITFMKSNSIKQSIFASAVVTIPHLIETDEEARELEETFTNAKGSDKAGNWIVLTSDGQENAAKVTPIQVNTSGLDGLFKQNEESIKESIMMAHNVPSQLLIATPGKLSNASEIEQLYAIFVETVTSKITALVNQQLKFLFKEIKFKGELVIFDLDYKAMFSDDDIDVIDQDDKTSKQDK